MAVAANSYLGLYLRYDFIKEYPLTIVAYFGLGAFIAALTLAVAVKITHRWLQRLPRWFIFLFTLACLTALTVGITAGLFALEYRSFYAQWHSPAFSRIWFFEQFFTLAGAYYQFAVLGLRLYLPLTPFIIFLATIILTRRIS